MVEPWYYLKRFTTNYRTVGWKGLFALSSLPKSDQVGNRMEKLRILDVDNNDGLRAKLTNALGGLGHDVVATGDRKEALGRNDLDGFDVIISDLTEEGSEDDISDIQRKRLLTPISIRNGEQQTEIVKAFKLGAVNLYGNDRTH